MDEMLAIALHLVLLHTVDGRDIHLNPAQITTVQEGREPGDPKRELTDKVRCAIGLSNGHFVSVIEECDVVRSLIEEANR